MSAAKETKKQIVLRLLLAAYPGSVTSRELVNAGSGWRYGARMWELGQEGYDIASARVEQSEPGLWKFWLRYREPVSKLQVGQQAEMAL